MGCPLNHDEISELFSMFDKNGDGVLDLNEFLYGVRGEMNEVRKPIVLAAFAKFDNDGSGKISKDDLKGTYDCSRHPKVISGQMTEDQVLDKFMNSFGDTDNDHMINDTEWMYYYSCVSANIDNDDEFILMMTNAWKL